MAGCGSGRWVHYLFKTPSDEIRPKRALRHLLFLSFFPEFFDPSLLPFSIWTNNLIPLLTWTASTNKLDSRDSQCTSSKTSFQRRTYKPLPCLFNRVQQDGFISIRVHYDLELPSYKCWSRTQVSTSTTEMVIMCSKKHEQIVLLHSRFMYKVIPLCKF